MAWIFNAGQQLGHDRILEPLGAGGKGEVYLAEDVRLQRVCWSRRPRASSSGERYGLLLPDST